MKKLCFVLLLTISNSVFAGGTVGDGGFGIICRTAPQDNFLNGTYSLDYVLTLEDKKSDSNTIAIKSWDQSAERIYRLLLQKVPTLAPYFKEFHESAFKKDYTKTKVWEKAPFGLVKLDKNLPGTVPENCKTNGETMVIPAVIRPYESTTGTPGHIIYKYIPAVVEELNRTNPLQLSYLMVHEWLWDFSTNFDRNMRINRLIHSPEFERRSSAEIIAILKAMGFFIPESIPDVFSNTSCQGNPLSQKDVALRFSDRRSGTINLGKVQFFSQRRNIDCGIGSPNCTNEWRDQKSNGYVFQKFEFFSALYWQDRDNLSPVRIISPEHLESIRSGGHLDNAQMICTFINHATANIECYFTEQNVLYTLTRFDVQGRSRSDWPKVSGVFTDECLRIESRYIAQWPYRSPRGSGNLVEEVKSVLFVKYLWNK